MGIKYDGVDTSEYRQVNKSWLPGYVYVIDYGDGVTFKVGYTTVDPTTRINQIAKGSVIMPMHLVMSVYTDTNAFFLENIIQMKLDLLHVRGEWYTLHFIDLVELYQCMTFFGVPEVYERWYEIVPKDYKSYIEHYAITPNYPIFKKRTIKEIKEDSDVFAELLKEQGEINGN